MILQPVNKVEPELRGECFKFMVNNPIVQKWTNCISFATLDPFACILRGALNRDIVVPQILKTPEARKPRDFDMVIWWDDVNKPKGSYHFAFIYKDIYIMQLGRGKDFVSVPIKVGDADITAKFQHRKTAHTFKLPLRNRSRLRAKNAAWLYRAFYTKGFDKLLKWFNWYDAEISEHTQMSRR